jgi:CO dehydrogenase maturation factor
MGLIVNRAPNGVLDAGTLEEIEKQGLTLYGVLPHSDDIYRCDCEGTPSSKLPNENPTKKALHGVLNNLGL